MYDNPVLSHNKTENWLNLVKLKKNFTQKFGVANSRNQRISTLEIKGQKINNCPNQDLLTQYKMNFQSEKNAIQSHTNSLFLSEIEK